MMTTYSIVKAGKDYVVRADDVAVIKLASRRLAAQLVAEATSLLSVRQTDSGPALPAAAAVPSTPRDCPEAS